MANGESTWFPAVFWRKVALSFLRAFVAVFVLGLTGVVDALGPEGTDWNAAKSALVALVLAGLTAGVRALQALFTNLEPTK